MDHRRLRDGWVAWVLVLAAALPTAATIGLGWLAFSGSWDSPPARSRATTGRELLAYRWSDFWFNTPATTLLLTSLLPLLVLAVAALVDRPHFLLPTVAGRKAATTVGVVCTCLGLIEIVGFLGQLTGLLPVQSWNALTPELMAFAPFAAVAFSYLVLSAVITAVLWPRGDEEPAERPPNDSAVEAAVAEEAIAARAAQPIPTSEAVRAQPEPSQPGLLQPETPSAMPTPSAADLDRYRR